MKSNVQQRSEGLNLYGLVQSLSYVIRLNDLKTAQHFRARLAWVLRRPHNLVKPLYGDLKELFEISGLWLCNVGDRHDTKRQVQRTIRRIVPQLIVRYRGNKGSPGKTDERRRRMAVT
jgi:hypothetical protein